MIGIYKITNPKGKVYVGQSKDIKNRFKTYMSLRCKTQIKLHRSFLKYGVNNHKFEIVIECDYNQLNELERYYQEIYNCIGNKGLNLLLTSTDNLKTVFSLDTRIKMKNSSTGVKNANYGKPRSEETKLKISLSNKGVKRSEQAKLNMSKSKIGIKPSEETRKKMSEASLRNNKNAKIVLDINTGVFYNSAKEISILYNIKHQTMINLLNGRFKNNTSFKYV